ncbi:DNA helicase rad5 [Myotisia sp. PD_48]|nr:DNA helicase rad5 [Myotisia sp. PD_48]
MRTVKLRCQPDDMDATDLEHRPTKKRRFFDDKNGSSNKPAQLSESNVSSPDVGTIPDASAPVEHIETEIQETCQSQSGFDIEIFSAVIGEQVASDTLQRLRILAGDDTEKAINIYLDGSWENAATPNTDTGGHDTLNTADVPVSRTTLSPRTSDGPSALVKEVPADRYVGAFGVGGWATRSGQNMLQYGEEVIIRRSKMQPLMKVGRGGKMVPRVANGKGDVITRFTNSRGEEIGRLPQNTASWVSTLIDQKICRFTAVCVFAPDRIRVNDTIYLQIKCFIRNEAFKETYLAAIEDGIPRLFEQQETAEEKALRLRQVALVTLFDEIGLVPKSTNELTRGHKKEGILRAAEMAEQNVRTGSPSAAQRDADAGSDSEDGDKLEDEQLDTLYQKAQCFDFSMPEAIPAESFNLELRKYQKQALHWLMMKEKDVTTNRQSSMHPLWEEYTWPIKDVDDKPLPSLPGNDHFYVNPYSGELSLQFPVQEQNCLGGILADEMGLGKTIEMMSLIHSHKYNGEILNEDGFLRTNITTRPIFAPHTTLVVAPTSLLSQWESEAMKASKDGSMKVLVYYGTDKSVNLRNLCSARNPAAPNLIVTSYGVVRSEHSQILANRLNSNQGGLFSVDYFRIILDEAHYIKNRASKTARACYEINGKHRWVLTGTPIVNRLEDLYSLVRFLKVEPWSNFSFWKTFITVPFESKDFVRALNVVQTVLEPLVLRRTKTMKTPEGEALVPLPSRTITVEEIELSEREKEIYDVIFTRAKRTFNDNIAAGTLLKSYTTIFAQILRLRQTCCHPILTRNQSIVAEEEDAAIAANELNVLQDNMDLQELIDRFTSSMQAENGEEKDPTANFTTHALKQIQAESSGECPICSEEPMISPAVTGCWHSACKKCLESYIKHQSDKAEIPRCFSCRQPVTIQDIYEVVRHGSPSQTPPETESHSPRSSDQPSNSSAPRISLRRINPLSPSARTSAKIHALLTHLTRLPKGTKAVVFSQFTSFLDLISPQLTTAGISHLRFDGTMSHKARTEVLRQFNSTNEVFDDVEDEDDDALSPPNSQTRSRNIGVGSTNEKPSPSVLLISLRAGGVGLNLTVANHVFMMDPWWSFAVEAQAIDRVHRMGQLRDVNVTRFVIKNSIEGRILRVQERKMMIASSLGLKVGGDGGDEERRKERIEELKLLFE